MRILNLRLSTQEEEFTAKVEKMVTVIEDLKGEKVLVESELEEAKTSIEELNTKVLEITEAFEVEKVE